MPACSLTAAALFLLAVTYENDAMEEACENDA